MSETASKRLPVKPTTKKRLDEVKPEGETYDRLIRKEVLGDD
jgi:hypothetical protein